MQLQRYVTQVVWNIPYNVTTQDNMNKKRILLVEDDSKIAFVIGEYLTSLGPDYEIKSAASGEQALKEMDQGAWDLVITDNRMSGISGIELIESLKEKSPSTFTILMTGYGSHEVEQAAQQLNVYRYMKKPFPLADLRDVIRSVISLRQEGRSDDAPLPPADDRTTRPVVKVALVGDAAVGKSSLIHRLCTEQFRAKRVMTIGVDFHVYNVSHDFSATRLVVWDVGGQDRFAFTRRAFYRGSKAVGLVYDISDRTTFERLERWKIEIREMLPRVPLVLAGNKIDVPRQVTREEGQALADTWGIPFLETSCLSGQGVRDFFVLLAESAERMALSLNRASMQHHMQLASA
jgi:small GTP-binding protein